MLASMLSFVSWHDLPMIATWLFVAMFLTVLLRVSQKKRWREYDRMATLPLDDGAPVAAASATGASAQEEN